MHGHGSVRAWGGSSVGIGMPILEYIAATMDMPNPICNAGGARRGEVTRALQACASALSPLESKG